MTSVRTPESAAAGMPRTSTGLPTISSTTFSQMPCDESCCNVSSHFSHDIKRKVFFRIKTFPVKTFGPLRLILFFPAITFSIFIFSGFFVFSFAR
jgi:hypothetical protein